jgi:hypothetical protein
MIGIHCCTFRSNCRSSYVRLWAALPFNTRFCTLPLTPARAQGPEYITFKNLASLHKLKSMHARAISISTARRKCERQWNTFSSGGKGETQCPFAAVSRARGATLSNSLVFPTHLRPYSPHELASAHTILLFLAITAAAARRVGVKKDQERRRTARGLSPRKRP